MTYAEIHELRVGYRMAGRMLYDFGSGDKEELRSETREWRKWVNSFGTQHRRRVINWAFLSSVSSLLYSILLYFFGARPSINGVGTGFTTSGSQSMGGGVSPCTGSTERLPYGANQ
jgi:hypothetical protein